MRTPDGVDIAVHDLGGTGPPLLFSHATGLHGLVWAPVAGLLADAFHSASFDERGHGGSGVPPDGDFGWRGFATDALAAADTAFGGAERTDTAFGGAERTDERPAGVGHSSGATALLLAEQARPGAFRALYLFEPIVVLADPPLGRDAGNWLAAGARRRREVFGSRAEATAHYASKPPFAAWAPAALAAYVEHGFEDLPDGTVRLACRGEDEALMYEMASAHDGFARMPEVGCPVLLVAGADSDAVGPASAAALAGRLPHARTEVMAGVGHFGPLERPAAVAASVRRFLA